MKKARIFLTIIGIFSIVGAALAFKAMPAQNYIGCDGRFCYAVKNNGTAWTTVDQQLGQFPGTDVATNRACSIDADCGMLYIAPAE